MNIYFRSIVLTVAISHLFLLLTGELGGEHSRRFLRYLYGLILLLTLFAPLRNCILHFTELADTLHALMAAEEAVKQDPEEAVADSTYRYAAERIAAYLTEAYKIPTEDIRITIRTDDVHAIEQIEIALRNCYYARRQSIAEKVQEGTDIPILVKGW